MNKAIFLDRDGVINYDSENYIKDVDEVSFLPDIENHILEFQKLGYLIIIISNQSAVGRKLISINKLKEINEFIVEKLEEKECNIHDLYFCPHSPHDNCSCRKPKPGMILKASSKYKIDLSQSWMVGDKDTDIEAGKAAGCNTFKINTNSNLSDALNLIAKSTQE